MKNTKLWMADQKPSRFGMPTCGHAFDARSAVDVRDAVTGIAVATAGRLTASYFPGNLAWRPPTC